MQETSYARALANAGMIFGIGPEQTTQIDAAEPMEEQPDGPGRRDADVLLDRLTTIVVRHEPGWQLPRPSQLARRYNASYAQIATALEELVHRHLIRRMPDGHLIRTSAAEYLVPLEGIAGLHTRIDPMGADIAVRRYRVTRRAPPTEVAATLRASAHEPLTTLQLDWSLDGDPAAIVRTYLAAHLANLLGVDAEDGSSGQHSPTAPDIAAPALNTASYQPRAVTVEMQAAPPWAARDLHMPQNQLALLISVRFDDIAQNRPAAVTSAVFRPDRVRIALESAAAE